MTSGTEASSPGSRTLLLSAALFVFLFLAMAAFLGDILGSFGDPDDVFVEHYGSSSKRAGDIIGSLLLVLLGGSFVWHLDLVRRTFGGQRVEPVLDVPVLTSSAFAVALLIAAAALATVPLGREIGDLFDERRPRLEGSETAVLAQFGYVLLFGAGGITSAACVLFTSFHCAELALRVGLSWRTVAAAMLPLSAAAFMPFLALPVWVALTACATWLASKT
jgi:hypothetical protein